MRAKAELISQLTNPGVIAVVRAHKREQVLPMAEALVAGGVTAIEITMTTPDALAVIGETVEKMSDRALIGAGTVLDATTCRAVIAMGAQFIVSPICRVELAHIGFNAHRPVILGANTPTEAQLAHEVGANFIKIFPADTFGPGYIKALLVPMPHLRIVPTGGIGLNNLADFFQAGCSAVGVGSSLMSKEILEKNDWPQLTRRAAEFVKVAKTARK